MPPDTTQFDTRHLRDLLGAVGAHLEAGGHSAAVVVVGGAAMCLGGFVRRTTHDVDVIAVLDESAGDRWVPPELDDALERATRRVGRDFNLADDWFNATVGAQWQTGLPDGIHEGVVWHHFRALRVGVVSRRTLITLKLFAAVDRGADSVHLQDLRALAPTDDELRDARAWVVRQDLNPDFPRVVDEVIAHAR